MTAVQIATKLQAKIICDSGTANVTEVYAGDFLSRVISKAPSNSIWLTIMGNANVAAVAVLAEISVVVLCENVQPDKLLIDRCTSEDIALLVSPLSVYQCCKLL